MCCYGDGKEVRSTRKLSRRTKSIFVPFTSASGAASEAHSRAVKLAAARWPLWRGWGVVHCLSQNMVPHEQSLRSVSSARCQRAPVLFTPAASISPAYCESAMSGYRAVSAPQVSALCAPLASRSFSRRYSRTALFFARRSICPLTGFVLAECRKIRESEN
eukprot:SAG11_NODE_10215_length_846_cov_1.534137_1_plen_161_part_00